MHSRMPHSNWLVWYRHHAACRQLVHILPKLNSFLTLATDKDKEWQLLNK